MRSRTNRYFLMYQLQVTILLTVSFGYLIFKKTGYVYFDIGADTYCSYWPTYAFLQKLMKDGQGLWSFQLGLGGNILNNASLLLDPFNLILFRFPREYLFEGILTTAIVKYYVLSWLAYAYLKRMGAQNIGLVAGALCYTFSGYFVGWGQHYQFATAFLFLTACLWAMERWLGTGKWGLFTIFVGAMAAFSLYFCYMILLFLGIYALFRYAAIYRKFQWKTFVCYVGQLMFYVLGGFGLVGVSVIPQAMILLGAARVTGRLCVPLSLASLGEWFELLLRFLSNNALGINNYCGTGRFNFAEDNYYEAPFLFVGVLAVFLLPILLKKESLSRVGRVAGICVVGALFFFRAVSIVFNGFSTITLRWTMILVPVLCLGLCQGMKLLLHDPGTYGHCAALGGCVAASLLVIAVLGYQRIFQEELTSQAAVYLLLPMVALLLYGLVLLLGVSQGRARKWLPLALSLALMVDLGLNLFFSVDLRSTVSKANAGYLDGTGEAVSYLEDIDKGFYRVERNYRTADLTDGMAQGYCGESQYSSTYPIWFSRFLEAYELRYPASNYLWGLDDKQTLRNFLAGKYLLSKTDISRSGYVIVGQVGEIRIYENQNALPLGILQMGAHPLKELDVLSLREKQDLLYSGFFTEEPELLEKYSDSGRDISLLCPWNDSGELILDQYGNGIGIKLHEPSRQTMLLRLTYSSDRYTLGERIESEVVVKIEGGNEYTIPLYGISKGEMAETETEISALGVVEIRWGTFPVMVDLSLKDDALESQLCADLRGQAMTQTVHTGSRVEGITSGKVDAMLVTSIPYDAGWSAYIDGVETPVHQVNVNFSGIEVPAGEHRIQWRYTPPGLHAGGILSGVSAVVLAAVSWERRKKTLFVQEAEKA